jgi:hypothetical protein
MDTMEKYMEKAEKLIKRGDSRVYDVASNMFPAQIVENVSHMRVFKLAVARSLLDDDFADAFYDENYKKMSSLLGKKVTSQIQAETEFEKFKKKLEKVI